MSDKHPRSLVTGVAGFLGSHVADALLALGHTVTGLDDFSGGFMENIPARVYTYKMSVCDHKAIDSLFDMVGGFDYVFHLAAYAAEGLSPHIRRFNYQNNLIGSVNLINASVRHKVRCFVFTSSIAVYGHLTPPFSEAMTPQPADPYGIAKYAVELDLKDAATRFGLPFIIFRPHNVYGERQNIGDPYRNVIGIWMNQILKGEPCRIFGDGEQRRAFSPVDAVAPDIAQSVNFPEAYNQVFNVGSDRPCTLNSLCEAVRRAMGIDTGVEYVPERAEVRDAWCDHTLIRSVIPHNGFYQLLADPLARMAQWVKQHGARQSPPFAAGIEIQAGLPEVWREL